MSALLVRREYANATVLFESDLDAFLDDIKTFVNTTKLEGSNFQDNGITASTKFVDNSVVTSLIADSAITNPKIAPANITAGKLGAGAVTTAKILDAAVTTDKIANSAISGALFNNGAITRAKLASVTSATAQSAGLFQTTADIYTDVTGISVTISVTATRDVLLVIDPADLTDSAFISAAGGTGIPQARSGIRLYNDTTATVVATWTLGYWCAGSTGILELQTPTSNYMAIDTAPATGSNTYKLQVLDILATSPSGLTTLNKATILKAVVI